MQCLKILVTNNTSSFPRDGFVCLDAVSHVAHPQHTPTQALLFALRQCHSGLDRPVYCWPQT